MKCIKAIRKTKDVEIGEIKRVDDKTANNMVGSMWQYISKSEWKQATRNQVGTKSEPSQDQVVKKRNPKQDFPNDNGGEFKKTRKKSKKNEN
jgi:hypothetical protein